MSPKHFTLYNNNNNRQMQEEEKKGNENVTGGAVHWLVDGDPDGAEEEPLADVVQVHAQPEDNQQHQHHAPELPAAPLRQAQLRQELAGHVVHLLSALLSQPALAWEGGPGKERGQRSFLYVCLLECIFCCCRWWWWGLFVCVCACLCFFFFFYLQLCDFHIQKKWWS